MLTPACIATLLAVVGVTVDAAPRESATYYIPDTETSEHKLVTQQLEAIGIDRFVPADAPKDVGERWSLVSSKHNQIDLVWSTAAQTPVELMGFASNYKTKVNHVPGSSVRITDADEFYKHIENFQHKKEKYMFNFVPRHLRLPRDQAQMPKVFEETLKRVEYELKREDDWYIYQRFLVREVPADGNDNSLAAGTIIATNEELQAKLTSAFNGKTVEVTQYIEPHLIDGHKFQVGFYVAVTSIDPLRMYYYGHPQIKIAKAPYPAKMDANADPKAYNFNEYIAPWDFPDLQALYQEFPSTERPGTNSWTVLKRYMTLQGLDTVRVQKEINAAIAASIASNRGYLQSRISKLQRTNTDGNAEHEDLESNFFELMRFDFQIDDLGKPWLMRVHSNPSMVPHQTVFGTDEAVKKHLLSDLLNLVGVHSQAKPSFDDFFLPTDAKFCSAKCTDNSRVWDTSCWSCPGWFAPYVARRLFDSMNEYARRGDFKLVYPSLDDDYTKYLDSAHSEHDNAFIRYVKSLSAAYADRRETLVSSTAVTCVYREHCSENGDCVNGKCVCDDEYEGATCYVPKDIEREKRLVAERAAAGKVRESWKDRFWGGDGAGVAENLNDAKEDKLDEAGGVSVGGLFFGLLFVGGFAYGGYQVFIAQGGGALMEKNN